MANDWIKMRTMQLTNPKVNNIAKIIGADDSLGEYLFVYANGCLDNTVTRNVTRYITLALLYVIWCNANEHSRNGVFENTDKTDIDDMVDLPGFASAMESVGWLVYDENENTITLPNFDEYNTCGNERKKSSNAERQKRYRERKKKEEVESGENSNVTRYVTRNDREEKRREENISFSESDSDALREVISAWTIDRRCTEYEAGRAFMRATEDLISEGLCANTDAALDFLVCKVCGFMRQCHDSGQEYHKGVVKWVQAKGYLDTYRNEIKPQGDNGADAELARLEEKRRRIEEGVEVES